MRGVSRPASGLTGSLGFSASCSACTTHGGVEAASRAVMAMQTLEGGSLYTRGACVVALTIRVREGRAPLAAWQGPTSEAATRMAEVARVARHEYIIEVPRRRVRWGFSLYKAHACTAHHQMSPELPFTKNQVRWCHVVDTITTNLHGLAKTCAPSQAQ